MLSLELFEATRLRRTITLETPHVYELSKWHRCFWVSLVYMDGCDHVCASAVPCVHAMTHYGRQSAALHLRPGFIL